MFDVCLISYGISPSVSFGTSMCTCNLGPMKLIKWLLSAELVVVCL